MNEHWIEFLTSFIITLLYGGALFLWYKLSYKGNNLMRFTKNRLLPFVLIVGFVLYLIGYGVASAPSCNFAVVGLALYSTARLLILGNDMVEIKEIFHSATGENGQIVNDTHQMLMELLHLGISLILATVVFIFVLIFLRVIASTLKNRRKIRKSKALENYIFFSATPASISLAKDILKDENRRKNSLILFIECFINNEEKHWVKQLEAEGAIIVGEESFLDKFDLKNEELMISLGLHSHDNEKKPTEFKGDFFARHQLKDCILKRKTHLFFFSEDEEQNVKQAKQIIDELNQMDPGIGQIKNFILYVRTLVQDFLEDEYDELVLKRGSDIELRYINDTLIAAKRLVKDYPPVKYVNPDTELALAREDFTPLLLGFGRIGQSVLRKLVEMGSFLGNSFRAVVIDDKMKELVGRFDNRFPGLSKNYSIDFWHLAAGEKALYEYLHKHSEFFKYVVISLGNDELNMLVGMEIKKLAKRLNVPYSIFIHINDESRYDQLFNLNEKSDSNLNVFGRMEYIYKYEDIIDNTVYKQAQKIHDMYMRHSDPERKEDTAWIDLDRMKKLSNISVMEHLSTKCQLAGLSQQEIMQMDSEAAFVNALGEDRLLNLTIGEHVRWNAHYFTNGWDTLPINEIINHKTKIYDRRLHSCLVSWEKLDDVIKETYDVKVYDRLNVIEMWEQLREKERVNLDADNNIEDDKIQN